MLFFSFFKTLVGQEVVVELKNGINVKGQLVSVDQYLNVKLQSLSVDDSSRYPQLSCLKNCFIRGSVIRYIMIPPAAVDVDLLQDAARKENASK
eukprot:gene6479-7144_t